MKQARLPVALAALVLLLLQSGTRAQTPYVTPSDIDLKEVLSPPPADASAEHQAEVQHMLDLQDHRTREEVDRCDSEVEADPFIFHEVLGAWFNAKDLPDTAEFLRHVSVDGAAVTKAAKKVYPRQRPPIADDRIKPCVPMEKTNSYPSGHATRGIVWATVLSEMFPDHKDQLMARGKEIGDDRFLAGIHYPSDVAAGQKLGAAIAAKMLANPQFKADLEKAKEECLADAAGKK